MNEPSIGASLIDQEAVTLNSNLQGKKKKKKSKKGKVNPNSFLDQNNSLDLGQSSLANAGRAVVKETDENFVEALPELDVDLNNDNDARNTVEWDYNNYEGAAAH